MTEQELGEILKNMYENANKGKKATVVHLFGMDCANEIRTNNLSIDKIIKESGILKSL